VGGIGQILMIELRITDPKLDVKFRMKYQLIELLRTLLSLFSFEIYFILLEISNTPSTVLKQTTLSLEKHVNTRNSLFTECGITWTNENRYYREISSRIVGGRQAVPHSHPWQVLLNNRGQFCGG
jgi:hypothetical protein